MRYWFVGIGVVALALGISMPVFGGVVGLDLKPVKDETVQNDAGSSDKAVESDNNAGDTEGASTDKKNDVVVDVPNNTDTGTPPPAESPKVKTMKERVAALESQLSALKETMAKGLDTERTALESDVASVEGEMASATKQVPELLAEVRKDNAAWATESLGAVRKAVEDFTAALGEIHVKPAAPAAAEQH